MVMVLIGLQIHLVYYWSLDNTEIAVHDAGNRVSFLIQYQGGASTMITIGRDMFWGTVPVTIANNNIWGCDM